MVPKNIDITQGNNKTQFINKLNEIYENELKAKIKKFGEVMPDGSKTVLSAKEISQLRNHPDLGLWNSKGRPISLNKVNAHFRWYEKQEGFRPKKSPLQVVGVNPPKIKGYTRDFLESQKSITREVRNWIKRLNGEEWTEGGKVHKATGINSWPPGLNEKNIWEQVSKSGIEVGEYNNKLFEELGFKFQKGHGWGVMGPPDGRTWVIPHYGSRSEGHFTFRNVAPQPQSPTFKQLTHKFWNAIIPNVPSKYSKHGVQIESAEDLKLAGGGGQGWRGTMEDILLSNTPNIDDFDKLPLEQKAYILFGDPGKGAGATAESRYFQIKNNQWDEVLETLAEGAETAENLSGPVKTSNIYDQPFDSPHLMKNLPKEVIAKLNAIRNMPVAERRLAVKALAGTGVLTLYGGFGTTMSAVETIGRKSIYDETQHPLDKLQYNISAFSLASDLVSYVPTPVTTFGGSITSGVADFSNTLIDTVRNPMSEEELQKSFNLANSLIEGSKLTLSPSSPSFMQHNNTPQFTSPHTVEIEEEDKKTGETVTNRYQGLTLPEA